MQNNTVLKFVSNIYLQNLLHLFTGKKEIYIMSYIHVCSYVQYSFASWKTIRFSTNNFNRPQCSVKSQSKFNGKLKSKTPEFWSQLMLPWWMLQRLWLHQRTLKTCSATFQEPPHPNAPRFPFLHHHASLCLPSLPPCCLRKKTGQHLAEFMRENW